MVYDDFFIIQHCYSINLFVINFFFLGIFSVNIINRISIQVNAYINSFAISVTLSIDCFLLHYEKYNYYWRKVN